MEPSRVGPRKKLAMSLGLLQLPTEARTWTACNAVVPLLWDSVMENRQAGGRLSVEFQRASMGP